MFLADCLVSWKTKKQKTVSKSSTESEYRSMSQTTSELVWMDGVLEDLLCNIPKPIQLFCDNISAHYLAHNPVFHERTKHLKVDCHYVREYLDASFLSTDFIRSASQIADIMTKSLCAKQHHLLCAKLGLVSRDGSGSWTRPGSVDPNPFFRVWILKLWTRWIRVGSGPTCQITYPGPDLHNKPGPGSADPF